MADHSNSNPGRKPVAEMPLPPTQEPGCGDLHQARITLEHELGLAQHASRSAVDILQQALYLMQQIESGNKPTKLLSTVADHIRSALALLDNEVTRD